MDYKEATEFLFNSLPMYQRIGKIAYKKDIGNIKIACEEFNHPQKNFKSIHVGGTNGKGSVSHMLASVLQEKKLKVGLYTSPHLKDFRERIKINGKPISKEKVVEFVKNNFDFFKKNKLSFFEMTVLLSFLHFSSEKVDIAVIEVGLGGRLDSTNIINPILSVITNISLDHTNLLGNSIEKIAQEKGGIIKRNTPIIIGRKNKISDSIFYKIASEKKSKIFFSNKKNNYTTDLNGDFQIENINTAEKTFQILNEEKILNISEIEISKGLNRVIKNTGLRGRWEITSLKPKTIFDIGHNIDAINKSINEINELSYENIHMVIGFVNDKNLKKIFNLLPKNAFYYFCKPNIPRGFCERELLKMSQKFNLSGNCFSSSFIAFEKANEKANENDIIFVGGSTFLVGELI
ncbi:Mur ligase family protein [Bacteroidota bacterium]|nr:Mur ligase family protein [Bacteroidota bacterium]MDC3153992.1 Mur ligase family protein [Bacteroidota bacterium]